MFEVGANTKYLFSNTSFYVLAQQNQPATPNWDAPLPASIKWLFFNVALALLPLLLNLIVVKLSKITLTSKWELLKDGELFFFSTTIAASSIGTLLFKNPSSPIVALLVSYVLLVVLMVATGMFALASLQKLTKKNLVDCDVLSISSTWCAIITIILGYVAFVQGGMK